MNIQNRLYYQRQIHDLRPYILNAFYNMNIKTCQSCGSSANLEINHKRYGDKITIDDLELLCRDCHALKTLIANDLQLSMSDYCPYCGR